MPWTGNKAPQQETEATTSLGQWVEDEFERFSNEQIDNLQAVDLRSIYNSPLRPRAGMIVYSDATKFDPGYGEGWYGRSVGGVWIPLGVLGFQEVLTANRTYYVRSDGNDANDGKTNSAGGAFLTGQAAINAAMKLVFNNFLVVIQFVNDASTPQTYTGTMSVPGPINTGPTGRLIIRGDNTTPSNLVLNTGGLNAITVSGYGASLFVEGFKILTSGGASGLFAITGGRIQCQNKMEFGACSTPLQAVAGGIILMQVAFTLSGNTIFWAYASSGGYIQINNLTVTLTGTPAWAGFGVYATAAGIVDLQGIAFSGAATGTKYQIDTAGGVLLNGAGLATLPGTAATGTETAPGWHT